MITYTKPGRSAGDGYNVDGADTTVLRRDDPLYNTVWTWLFEKQHVDPRAVSNLILITSEGHWSGYSEFTKSDEWEGIVVTVPAADFEYRWDTLPEFLQDMTNAARGPRE